MLIFWVLFVVAVGLFAQRAYFLFCLMRLGKPENRFDRIGERIKTMLVEVVPQWCSLKTVTRKDLSGIGHALLFWGFSLFLISYIIFIGLAGGFGLSSLIEGSAFETVYSSILDIAALWVIVVLVWAAIRRYIVRPERLQISAEAAIILMVVFSLMVLHFCIEGFGLAGSGVTAGWPPVGTAIAGFLSGAGISKGTLTGVSRAAWWLHYALILGFMVYIPRSKHLHVLASLFNAFFKPLGPKVVLEPIPVEEQENFGASKIQDFKWKDLLDLYACAVCGRCHANCPAHLSGKTLSPREVIHNLKEHLLEAGPALLASQRNGNTEATSENPAEPAAEAQAATQANVAGKEYDWRRSHRGGDLGLHNLRRMPGGMPGQYRTHPQDHRPQAKSGDGTEQDAGKRPADAPEYAAERTPMGRSPVDEAEGRLDNRSGPQGIG